LTKRLASAQILVLATGLAATALVASVPSLDFAYRNGDVHVAIETVATGVALLVAFLLYGRLRQSGSRSDLALIAGLLLLSLSNLGRALVPAFNGENELVVWVPLTTRVVGAAVLAWSAFAAPVPLRKQGRAPLYLALGVAGIVLVVAIGWAAVGSASTGINPNPSPAASDLPRIVGTPGLLATEVATIVLIGAVAVGFTRRARRTGDELLGWIALAATLAAVARLNYLMVPSVYSDWVFTGDLMRLGAYLLILIGALREIAGYQRSAAQAAALEERARLARDLHDGLAQDLAYISMESHRLAERAPIGAALANAADHALAQSRGAITELRATDCSLTTAVASLARALTERAGVGLELELDEDADADPEVRQNLLRILSEAISNAVRHGGASAIRVALVNNGGLHLSIADDGAGFNPDQSGNGDFHTGFGLIGMSERAAQLGGKLRVTSRAGRGTEIEVALP
jgi:signal transduction histidine kinase